MHKSADHIQGRCAEMADILRAIERKHISSLDELRLLLLTRSLHLQQSVASTTDDPSPTLRPAANDESDLIVGPEHPMRNC